MLVLRFVQNWLFFNLNVASSRYCCQSTSQADRSVSVDKSVRPKIECSPFNPLQFCWPQAAVVQSRLSADAVEVPGKAKQTVRTLYVNTNGSVTNTSWTASASASSSEKIWAMVRSWYGYSSLVSPKSHSPARTMSIAVVWRWCLLAAVSTTDGWISEPAPLYSKVCCRAFFFRLRNIATVHGNSPWMHLIFILDGMS